MKKTTLFISISVLFISTIYSQTTPNDTILNNTVIEYNDSFQPLNVLQQNQENNLQIIPDIKVEEESNFGSDVAIDGNTMVVGCEGLALAYVLEKEGDEWVYRGKLTSDLLKTGSAFGHSVDIDGDTIVVGADYESADKFRGYPINEPGRAFVFVKPDEGWRDMTESAVLIPTDGITSSTYQNRFGISVAIYNETIVVGASFGRRYTVNSGTGRAYVFDKPESGWQSNIQESAKLLSFNSEYGHSVDIWEDTIVVGANIHNGDKVLVYQKPEDGWKDMSYTAILSPSNFDSSIYRYFGTSVSIFKNTIAVAGWTKDTNNIFIFEKPSDGWIDMTENLRLEGNGSINDLNSLIDLHEDLLVCYSPHIDTDNVSYSFIIHQRTNKQWNVVARLRLTDSNVGSALSVTEDRVIVGVPNIYYLKLKTGAVYVFEQPNDGWKNLNETKKIIGSDGVIYKQRIDKTYGKAVSMSDDILVTGVSQIDGITSNSSLAVNVFRKQKEVWDYEATFKPDIVSATNKYGNSVSVSGNIIAVGAPGYDNGIGYVEIFNHHNNEWHHEETIHPEHNVENQLFGNTVVVNGDQLIIGVPCDSSQGFEVGSAFIYERYNGQWNLEKHLTAFDPDIGDQFGHSVSIANNVAVVAAPLDTELGLFGGSVYIFEKNNDQWQFVQKLLYSNPDKAREVFFGDSVSISNGRIAIGAYGARVPEEFSAWYFNNYGGNYALYTNLGGVFIYEKDASKWVLTNELFPVTDKYGFLFGTNVILNGNRLVANGRSGAVFIFDCVEGYWRQTNHIVAPLLLTENGSYIFQSNFRYPLSTAGDYFVAGTSFDSHFHGSAHIFKTNELLSNDVTPIIYPTLTPTQILTQLPTETATFTNTPRPGNTPPDINATTVDHGAKLVNESVSFNVFITDIDNDPLKISLSSNAQANIDRTIINGSQLIAVISLDTSRAGEYQFSIIGYDGSDTTTQEIKFSVVSEIVDPIPTITNTAPFTATPIPVPPTLTAVQADTLLPTLTPTATATNTPSYTPSFTPTQTPTFTSTQTPTSSSTPTPASIIIDEIILAQGQGGESVVQIRNFDDQSGQPKNAILDSYRVLNPRMNASIGGGIDRAVHLAVGDVDNDGSDDVVHTFGAVTSESLVPNIVIPMNILTKKVIGHSFNAFPAVGGSISYSTGELFAAVGDFIEDGKNILAVAQGIGSRNGLVRLFEYTGDPAPRSWRIVGQFQPLDDRPTQNNANGGVTLAAGDVDGDGRDELVAGQTSSDTSLSQFTVIDLDDPRNPVRHNFTAFPPGFRGNGGVELVVADLDGDGNNEIVASSLGNNLDGETKNVISVIRPLMLNGNLVGFTRPDASVIKLIGDDTLNPNGALHIDAGEFDGNGTNGDEIIFSGGEGAIRSFYRLVKIEYNPNAGRSGAVGSFTFLTGPPRNTDILLESLWGGDGAYNGDTVVRVINMGDKVVSQPTSTSTPFLTNTPTPTPALGDNPTSTNAFTIQLPGLSPDSTSLDLVWIEPGTFLMGSPESESDRSDDEGPLHEVTISKGFYMGKYEVTQAQWESVMGNIPSDSRYVSDNNPVNNVSWDDCQEFTGKLNEMGIGEFRLPTEAEWEYAGRAGTTTRFYWGDRYDESANAYAWSRNNADRRSMSAVGLLLPNTLGLFDMCGHVSEWCLDWYGDYPDESVTDPMGPSTGSTRVFRGGSKSDNLGDIRLAKRNSETPDSQFHVRGFRIIATHLNTESSIVATPTPTLTPTPFIKPDSTLVTINVTKNTATQMWNYVEISLQSIVKDLYPNFDYIEILDDPNFGELTNVPSNNQIVSEIIDYNPNLFFEGFDLFAIRVFQNGIYSDPHHIILDVYKNFKPIVRDQYVNVAQGASVSIQLDGVDPEGNLSGFRILHLNSKGDIQEFNSKNGTLIYSANNDSTGSDAILFFADDTGGITSSATLIINIWDGNGPEPTPQPTPTPTPAPNNTININTPENFPDPAFRRAMEILVGVGPGEPYTAADAAQFTGTYVFIDPLIKNINGIDFFINLHSFKHDARFTHILID